jgi:hypothetical protein
MPVPPGTVAYDIGAGDSREVSRGVFRPELNVPDEPENDKSIDKEGVILGVLCMLFDDIPGVVGFIAKGRLWWGVLYTRTKTRGGQIRGEGKNDMEFI